MEPWQVGLFIIIPGIVGLLIGRRKGYPVWGLLAGLVVSWLGVLAMALWRTSHNELIRRERERLAVERGSERRAVMTVAPPPLGVQGGRLADRRRGRRRDHHRVHKHGTIG
jgi:hypothetical protein